jgi:hypothetical protein
MSQIVLGAAFLILSIAMANADPRCDVPPYGDTRTIFQEFEQTMGTLDPNGFQLLLSRVCNAKYGDDPHTINIMHELGFTDGQINLENTTTLAKRMLDKYASGEWNGK